MQYFEKGFLVRWINFSEKSFVPGTFLDDVPLWPFLPTKLILD